MELLANAVFWTAVLANLTAQTLKLLLYYFLEGRFQWHRFLDTGGMPSTHSATVSALAVSVGLRDCLLYTSPSPRDGLLSRMPSSA